MTSEAWAAGDRWDPGNPNNRDRIRALRADLRALLMDKWDPIGVRGVPEAQDEYDGYLGPVMRLLHQGARHEDIKRHLLRITNESMGLSSDGTREAQVADDLIRWWSTRTA